MRNKVSDINLFVKDYKTTQCLETSVIHSESNYNNYYYNLEQERTFLN